MIRINIHTHKVVNDNAKSVVSMHHHFEQVSSLGYYSLGLHPWHLNSQTLEEDFELLKKYSVLPNVLAIGECGLDKVCATDFQAQQKAFSMQIDWANEIKKPLIIHCVRAHNETLQMLREKAVKVPVVFHGFNKNIEIAKQILHAGYYLSFGKSLMKEEMESVFQEVPLNRILLETDNSELGIDEVYNQAAKIRNISMKIIENQIETNASNIFGLSIIQ